MATHGPSVLVLVDTSTTWGRGLIRGVLAHARRRGPWRLHVEARGQTERHRPPAGWRGDGIIARVNTPALARSLAARRAAVVNVSGIEVGGPAFPRVTTDLAASARMGAEHFLDRGLRRFGYCGPHQRLYVERHREAFAEAVGAVGSDCPTFVRQPRPGDDRSGALVRWLRRLPLPAGVLAWGLFGMTVLEACERAGLRVPEDIAVLGGAEDELLYETVSPPLSGIAGNPERIGLEAAALLDRLMEGGRPPADPVLVSPTHVVCRQSTDTLAIEDIELVAAIRFIRGHAGDPIRVEDILRAVPMSRRALERRFHNVLGRTPAAEIRRVHVDRARRLLAETDLPIPDVASASGFGSPEYLAVVFKAETGLSPLRYRSRVRARSIRG